MLKTLKTRFKAAGVHLSISACVATLFAMLVFLIWYPGPLALASGVRNIFLLLLLVDIVLGPVITLLVFNPAKRELKRDLSIVAALQFAALFYGLHTVYVARPVYIVFSVDRFELVNANDFTDEKLEKARENRYAHLPKLGPDLLAAKQPDNAEERKALLFASLSGGDDLQHMLQYYVPYSELTTDIRRKLYSLSKLQDFNKDKMQKIEALFAKYKKLNIEVGYLPLRGRAKDLVVIVNRNNGNVMEYVDLMPWR